MTAAGRFPPWDDEAEAPYSEEIARRLLALLQWVRIHARAELLDSALIKSFHRYAFEAAVPHLAGVIRGPELPFPVSFGRYSGTPPQDCPQAFEELSQQTLAYLAQVDTLPGDQRIEAAIELAAVHHAKLIRIHPFANGNGRIGRVCINYFAARYGLRLLELPRPHDRAYLDALGAFLDYEKATPLVELLRVQLRPTQGGDP